MCSPSSPSAVSSGQFCLKSLVNIHPPYICLICRTELLRKNLIRFPHFEKNSYLSLSSHLEEYQVSRAWILSSFSLREDRLEVEVEVEGPTLFLSDPPRQSIDICLCCSTTDFSMVSKLCWSLSKMLQFSSVSSCPVLSILEHKMKDLLQFLLEKCRKQSQNRFEIEIYKVD